MAEMKARHAFGKSSSIETAKQIGKINEYDILFLDGDTDPKIGWLDAQGNTIIVPNKTDLSGVEAAIATKADATDVETLESQLATKANSSDVTELSEELATKVDAATVQTMIEEHSKVVVEVVEF